MSLEMGLLLQQDLGVELSSVEAFWFIFSMMIIVIFTFTFSHLADALIRDLQLVQGHSPEANRVKCLVQGHNIKCHGRGSNRHPSDYQPDSLTAQPPDMKEVEEADDDNHNDVRSEVENEDENNADDNAN